MTNSINKKLKEGASIKKEEGALISSVKEIRRVADTNQLRLRHLELAVANLTTICNTIRNDMRCSPQSASATNGSTDDVLGVQMQLLLHQAASLGIIKDDNTNYSLINPPGNMETISKACTKPSLKKVQTTNQKSMTKSLVKSMESSTIEKKMSKKLHNMGTTQTKPKTPQQNNPNKNIKKSTVMKTKTTSIANMYVNKSAEKKNRESSLKKNVEKLQGKGKWSTAQDITFKKWS
ncbi:unnamed protein product [Amaranthus hypochondriacus]